MKRSLGLAFLMSALAVAGSSQSADGIFASGAIGGALDAWHAAAAAADEEKYFSYFTADAVFLGTDASERWTRDEFRKWAHPYFAKGKAWNFKSVSRWITFAPDHTVAWFDEALDTPNMGPCRGSGVLVATNGITGSRHRDEFDEGRIRAVDRIERPCRGLLVDFDPGTARPGRAVQRSVNANSDRAQA